MTENTKKKKSNREAERKWQKKNREHRNYLTRRSTARAFIRKQSSREDLDLLEELIQNRREFLNIMDEKSEEDMMDMLLACGISKEEADRFLSEQIVNVYTPEEFVDIWRDWFDRERWFADYPNATEEDYLDEIEQYFDDVDLPAGDYDALTNKLRNIECGVFGQGSFHNEEYKGSPIVIEIIL